MTLARILAATPVRSVGDAIAVMREIDAALPDHDGVKWFNRLYLRVTEDVAAELNGPLFRDPVFLTTLDIIFANLYFAALTAGQSSAEEAPAAWRPLLRLRNSPGIERIQFALARMNAHINRDLPEGIVQSFIAVGGDPLADEVRACDFDNVNIILERAEADAKADFATGLIGVIDRVGGQADDAIAMWKLRTARSAAWTNAQVLWGLRPVPRLRARFFSRLDGLVGLTGQGLLQPREAVQRHLTGILER